MSNVTKRFGAFTAVSDLSLDVPEGAIIGFLGPNGAGKSTSLRMALGAQPSDVLQLVLRSGFRLIGLGLIIGLAGALSAGGLIASQLHDTAPDGHLADIG